MNNTMYEIAELVVGVPSNDAEQFVLYCGAVAISVLMFYFVLYLFKMLAGLIK